MEIKRYQQPPLAQDLRDLAIALACILSTLAVVVTGAMLFRKARCEDQAVSFEHEWGPIKGCMIRDVDGKWLPFEQYRKVN